MTIDAILKIDDIPGESMMKGHEGEITVLAWSWGMSQSGTMHIARGGGAGKANVQDLSFTKYVDKSTPKLMEACATGRHIPKAKLTLRKAGEKPLDYLVIELEEVLVSSVSTGGSGGEELLTENVSLNFARFKLSYQEQDASGGKAGGTVDVEFDIQANTT